MFFEPLGLLIAGMTLPSPRRTMRAATNALVAPRRRSPCTAWHSRRSASTGSSVSATSTAIRCARSAADSGASARWASLSRSHRFCFSRSPCCSSDRDDSAPGTYALVGVLGAGLLVSYVRTAALIALAVVGLALARRQRAFAAGLLLTVAVVVASAAFVFASEASTTQAVPLNATTYVTLNGRAAVWQEQLGNARYWVFGRGVGAIGTAAQRARETLSGKRLANSTDGGTVVDSGYLALVADVGAVGFGVLLLLFGRIALLARRAGTTSADGWVALALLLVMVIDALSRESFTAFPTAYVGMLLVGLSLSAGRAAGAPIAAVIDTHCHLLAGLDDGPRSFNDSIRMARRLAETGVELAVCTPHYNARFPTPVAAAAVAVRAACRCACHARDPARRCVSPPSSTPTRQPARLQAKSGAGGSRLASCLSSSCRRQRRREIERVIARLAELELAPVFAHPERCRAVQKQPGLLDGARSDGALVQVVASSLIPTASGPPPPPGWALLESGRADLVASDAHRPESGRIQLGTLRDEIARRYGAEAAAQLLTERARRVCSASRQRRRGRARLTVTSGRRVRPRGRAGRSAAAGGSRPRATRSSRRGSRA